MVRGLGGPVENARRALRWVASNAELFGWDRRNIGLYGVSAGGHVALMAASTMRDGDAFERSAVFRVFPESRPRELSPVAHVGPGLPPVLIFHGGADRTVHIDQSRTYVEALNEAGGDAGLVRCPAGDHAFLNLPDDAWYRQEPRTLEFFASAFEGSGSRTGG